MIHPVPGGPTLPERKRGGRKKVEVLSYGCLYFYYSIFLIISFSSFCVLFCFILLCFFYCFFSQVADENANDSEINIEKGGSAQGVGESIDSDKDKGSAGSGSGSGSILAVAGSTPTDVKKKNDDISTAPPLTTASGTGTATATVPSTGIPIKRRRRKRSTAEPSIDALCLHIKPGRKAGWAAIQAANAAAAAESLLDSGGEDLSGEEDDYDKSRKEGGAYTPGPMTPGSAAITGPFHILYGGCTHHTAGEGAIHTRSVDVHANIFHRESRSREMRKAILRQELLTITESLSKLQSMAAGRDKEKAAERERLRKAVLSRGAHSKVTGGGRNQAIGSNRLPGKTGLLRAIIDQQPVIKPVLLPSKPPICPVSDHSASVPPKVWMPTAALNLDTAHLSGPLSASSVADMETSSEASEGVGEGDGDGERDGGEGEGDGDDSVRKRARVESVRGEGGGGGSEGGSEGEGEGEGESERGIADQETEDEADPEKEESEDPDSDQDGVLAMAKIEASSDVETEDENFAEDEEEEEEDEGEGEGDTSYRTRDGDERVGGDGEEGEREGDGDDRRFEMDQEDSNGSSKYLQNENDNDNETEAEGDVEMDVRAQSFSSGEEDDEEEETEEVEEENDVYLSE